MPKSKPLAYCLSFLTVLLLIGCNSASHIAQEDLSYSNAMVNQATGDAKNGIHHLDSLAEKKVLQQTPYVIRRGDMIDVTVMEHPEFSLQGIVVLPDGSIQYPGFGGINVAGLTISELTESIENVLERYVVNPMVTIFIRRLHDQKINVFGYVNKPGQFQVYEAVNLFDVLGMAGGIRNYKRSRQILIIRKDLQVETYRVRDYLGGELQDSEIPHVFAGDTVFVVQPREVNWARWSFFASLTTTVITLLRFLQ